MKKQMLLVGIIFFLLVIIICGCTQEKTITNNESDDVTNDGNGGENSDDSSKFYGVWVEVADNQGTTMTMKHTYFEDGTYTFEILDIDHLDSGTWAVEDDKITTITSHVNIYSYAFSDNDTKLTLTDITTEEQSILSKQ